MEIKLHEIKIRDVFDGYLDSADNGVVGYHGRLNIRPAFQREFVYKDAQRDEVIKTVRKDFPLNIMYWSVSGQDENGNETYELLDGQQRTISVCQYVNGDFSVGEQYFHSLTQEEQNKILDYTFKVYICKGTERDKLDWFKIINIAGEELTPQELRNAIYTGTWLSSAKKYFSKTGCPAYNIGSDYISGTLNRQEYLETALKWIADKENCSIEDYMSAHQHDANADALWQYFKNVLDWVKVVFPMVSQSKKYMKGQPWGIYYNQYGATVQSSQIDKVLKLLADEDVTSKSGIFEYILDGKEKHLNIRAFMERDKQAVYAKQKGKCVVCGEHFEFNEMEADHITPWHLGGKTNAENCQMLCKDCNRRKSGK